MSETASWLTSPLKGTWREQQRVVGPNGQTQENSHQGRTPPPFTWSRGGGKRDTHHVQGRPGATLLPAGTSPGPGQGPPPRAEHCSKQSVGSFPLGLTHAGLVGDQGFAATGLKLVGEVRQVRSRPVQNQDELGEGAWKVEGKEG